MRWIFSLNLLFLITVPLGYAFQCFVCTKGDVSCDEPKKEHLQECSSVEGKVRTCVKISSQGQTIRTCGVPGLKTTECAATGGTNVCVCEREFCNSGLRLRQEFLLVLVGVLTTLFTGCRILN